MLKVFIASVMAIAVLAGCQTKNNNKASVPVTKTKVPIVLEQKTNTNIQVQNTNTNQNTNMEDTNIEEKNTKETTNEVAEYSKATFKTSMGDITVEFYKEESPNTVANFLKLASDGFYDGVKFHRVIKDFMIQAGDPQSKDDSLQNRWGTGGPGYQFDDEFNNKPLVQGSLAMANSGPNTNGSQFFIVTAATTPWLDGKHTNFGKVVEGLDIVIAINNTTTEGSDRPVEAVIINSIELE